MPHEPGHNENTTQASYRIVGTDKTYNGLVVMIGGHPYTTDGGTLQGNSQQLELIGNNNTSQTQTMSEDVVTPFEVGDNSTFGNGTYFYTDGSQVTIGTKLHHHTVRPAGRNSNFMTQHVMDGNDVDVFTEAPIQRTPQRQIRTEMTTPTRTQVTRRRTRTGGMGGRSGY